MDLSEIFHSLARQKESLIEEGHLQRDHVYMMISILPKYSVSQVVGYIKGRSAIAIARNYFDRVSMFFNPASEDVVIDARVPGNLGNRDIRLLNQ